MVARCATHFPVAYEAIPVPGQGFDYPCAGYHMIARQLVLRIRQKENRSRQLQILCGNPADRHTQARLKKHYYCTNVYMFGNWLQNLLN